MQFLRKISLFLLVFTSLHYFVSTQENNLQPVTIQNLCTLVDHMDYLNGFIKTADKRLHIIIANDMKDGIELANFMSNDNRVLFDENNKDPEKNLLYNEIIQNYFLYCNVKESSYFLVYPRDVKNEKLAMYLIKRAIDSTSQIKVVLTCPEEVNDENINDMFQFASSIYDKHDIDTNIIGFINIYFWQLKSSIKCNYVNAMNILEKYFHKQLPTFDNAADLDKIFTSESETYSVREKLLIAVIGSFVQNKLKNLNNQINVPCDKEALFIKLMSDRLYFKSLKFNNLLETDKNDETLKCFKEKLQTSSSSDLEQSRFNMSTLTGVFAFSDYVQTVYDLFSLRANEISTANLCQLKNEGILKLFFCIKSMSNAKTYFSDAWIETLNKFAESNLQKKRDWYLKLKSLFDDANKNSNFITLHELRSLKNEISGKDEKTEKFMISALSTVKNYTMRIQSNISCSSFKTGSKLQVRGNIIKISEVVQQPCAGQIIFIDIFALDKVIFDVDIIKIQEEIQVNIIAPVWEVVLDRTINLNGLDADNSWQPYKENCEKGISPDGLPGRPGGAGGTFFGLLDEFIEGKNLKISSNGGQGGDGQHACNFSNDKVGGNGGKRGAGGFHGLIQLFGFTDRKPSIFTYPVKNGSDGRPGEYGSILMTNLNSLENPDRCCKPHGKADYNIDGYQVSIKSIVLEDFNNTIKRYEEYRNTQLNYQLNYTIPNYYNILYFIKELTTLEDYYSIHLNRSDFLLMLKDWQNEFSNYISQRKKSEKTDDFTGIIFNMKKLVDNSISKMERKFYTQSILLIKDYVEGFIQSSKLLIDTKAINTINHIRNTFEISLKTHIEEAHHLINNELQVYLDDRIKDLHDEFKELIEEISELMKTKTNEIKILQEKRKKIDEVIRLRVMFSIFQFIFSALSFINPIFAVIGTILKSQHHIIEAQTFDSGGDSTLAPVTLPIAVSLSAVNHFRKYNEKQRKKIELVQKKLNEIREEKETLVNANENVQVLANAETEVTNLLNDLKSQNSCGGVRRLKNILNEIKETWTERNSANSNYDKQLKFIQRTTFSINLIELEVEYPNKVSHDLEVRDKLDNMIQESLDALKQLEQFKEKIQNHLEPKIEIIRNEMTHQIKEIALSSTTYREFQRWKIDDYLNDITEEFKLNTEQFKVHDSVVVTMTKLKSAIDTIINLHALVDEFQEKINNVEYMADIFSVMFEANVVNRRELRQPLRLMLQLHYANDVNSEYKKLETALKQYMFPLHNHISDLIDYSTQTFIDPVNRAYFSVQKMISIRAELNKKNGLAQQVQVEVMTDKFINSEYSSPFYVWSSSIYKTKIKDILKGNKVELFANISEHQKWNAVKFRQISILFTSNQETEVELKKDLSEFRAILIHNGDSHYKCDDKVHVIQSGAFQFHSKLFNTLERDMPYDRDTKLDYVLSPYATWFIQLKNNEQHGNFDKLNQYVNQVQIELVGEGQFINLEVDACKHI